MRIMKLHTTGCPRTYAKLSICSEGFRYEVEVVCLSTHLSGCKIGHIQNISPMKFFLLGWLSEV